MSNEQNIMPAEQLTQLLADTARQFRLGQEGSANAQYQQVVEQVQHWIAKASNQQAYMPVLSQLLNAQERHDWLDLADTLEYELTALIQHGNG